MPLNKPIPVAIKAMLIVIGMAFQLSTSAQNLIFNNDFKLDTSCCENNKKDEHLIGWYYSGLFHYRDKIDGRYYLNVPWFNKNNRYYSVTIGSLIKPTDANQIYKLKMRLYKKKSFYLAYAFVDQMPVRHNKDTASVRNIEFDSVFIPAKSRFIINVRSQEDSAMYLVLKFIDPASHNTPAILIRSIELVDPSETEQALHVKYLERIREIYTRRNFHDFEVECMGNRTLNR